MTRTKIFLIFIVFSFYHHYSFSQCWKPSGNFHYQSFCQIGALYNDSITGQLFAGGYFDTLGGIPANHLAQWNGNNWSAFGSGLPLQGISSITRFNGEIYVAIRNGANYKIYRWNGSQWVVFANPNGPVDILKTHNNKLYVGGSFNLISGNLVAGIAIWDGSSWSSPGGGVASFGTIYVHTMDFINDSLIIGGSFLTAGGITVNNIAKWNGTIWSAYGTGTKIGNDIINGNVYCVKMIENELYIGGAFDSAGGVFCSRIAKWTGNSWGNMDEGFDFPVAKIEKYNETIYAIGLFLHSGATAINGVAEWNGVSWLSPCNNLLQGNLGGSEIYNNELYFAGMGLTIPNGLDTIVAIARFGTINFQSQQLLCSNNCNGTAAASPFGVAPQTYQWSNGSTTQTITGLCPAIYSVTVTDSTGSQNFGSIEIIANSNLSVTDSIINASCFNCNDASINLGINGGVGQIDLIWSTGNTSNTISNLLTGNYTVTITDSLGCSIIDSINITYNCTANTTSQDPLCFKVCTGTANATSDGLPPFTFEWSTGATTQSIGFLCEGIYSVTVMDSNGISSSDTIQVSEPPELIVSNITTDASCSSCNNGGATAMVTGGTSPYNYEWSSGSTNASATNLLPGEYYVSVTDSNDCLTIDTVTVGFDVGLSVELSIVNLLSIYPNPVSDKLTIELQNGIVPKEIEIIDAVGRVIMKLRQNKPTQFVIIKSLPSGIYFIKLQSQTGETQVKKFIKE